jgi:hypothetical protein
LTFSDGSGTLTCDSSVGYDPSIPNIADLATTASAQVRIASGHAIPLISSIPSHGLYFALTRDFTITGEYSLDIDSSVVRIAASNRTGLFYCFQTFLQLLPPKSFSTNSSSAR